VALRLKAKCHDTLAHCPYNSESFDIKSLPEQSVEQIHDTYPIYYIRKKALKPHTHQGICHSYLIVIVITVPMYVCVHSF